jgi:hypothetical protein
VTISIKLPDDQGILYVALETGNAFVGLEAPDGTYQYVADNAAEGERQFVIGDQPTAIRARYVLTVPGAIALLTACLAEPGPFAGSAWDRQ